MVEENVPPNKNSQVKCVKTTAPKPPKPVYLWTVADVQKWFKLHCSELTNYAELFLKHEITGRALLRVSDDALQRMGITDNKDREAIWREIVKQRLRTDIMEIRDLQRLHRY